VFPVVAGGTKVTRGEGWVGVTKGDQKLHDTKKFRSVKERKRGEKFEF
jgi:hypothetical protein